MNRLLDRLSGLCDGELLCADRSNSFFRRALHLRGIEKNWKKYTNNNSLTCQARALGSAGPAYDRAAMAAFKFASRRAVRKFYHR
jgi:hypothetical protein